MGGVIRPMQNSYDEEEDNEFNTWLNDRLRHDLDEQTTATV